MSEIPDMFHEATVMHYRCYKHLEGLLVHRLQGHKQAFKAQPTLLHVTCCTYLTYLNKWGNYVQLYGVAREWRVCTMVWHLLCEHLYVYEILAHIVLLCQIWAALGDTHSCCKLHKQCWLHVFLRASQSDSKNGKVVCPERYYYYPFSIKSTPWDKNSKLPGFSDT